VKTVDAAIFGPPGAGKGTQAEALCRRFGMAHLATGDMLRRAISGGTELGRQVQAIVESGRLVDDPTVGRVVAARLDEEDAREGALFDGFPRTLGQVGLLDEILAERDRALRIVLELEVPEEEILRRLAGRRSCPEHGPLAPGLESCARCGAAGVLRKDDTAEVVRQRLEVYRRETAPVSQAYEDRGLLHRVDGSGTPEAVSERLAAVVSESTSGDA
jgi:adenylate kinase